MNRLRWFVVGALLLVACTSSTPPARGDRESVRVADRSGSVPARAETPPAPGDASSTAAALPTAPVGATGVVSNEGIGAFDRLPAERLEALKQRRVLWGHQSVGANLIDGARSLGFAFREVRSGSDYGEARWGESGVEENGDPERKIRSFVTLLTTDGIGARVEAASFKFCWVDFDDSTEIERLVDDYDAALRDLQARFPTVRFLHVTPPLTTDEPELNGRRWRFGRELIRRHRDTGLVFDLAAVISTDAAGEQCKSENQRRLCPGWASDSGHLNEAGSRRAAKAFLYAFYRLLS